MHTHKFLGNTSYVMGHKHYYKGLTSLDPDAPGHIHYLRGHTSYDMGHTHEFCFPSGPAIYVGDSHYHIYCGPTSINQEHAHEMGGATRSHSKKEYFCCY